MQRFERVVTDQVIGVLATCRTRKAASKLAAENNARRGPVEYRVRRVRFGVYKVEALQAQLIPVAS
jgi:hypothetical protein